MGILDKECIDITERNECYGEQNDYSVDAHCSLCDSTRDLLFFDHGVYCKSCAIEIGLVDSYLVGG